MRNTRVVVALLSIGVLPLGTEAAVVHESNAALYQRLDVAASSIVGRDQGVYVEAEDGTVLASRAAARPVHPASVSKVATTLALLRKFGPAHRFVTTFSASGCAFAGTLYGDLVVDSDGDPSLVDEDALLVAETLKRAGIERVTGGVRLAAPLIFDWASDSAGARLERALSGATPLAARSALSALSAVASNSASPVDPASMGLRFATGMATPLVGPSEERAVVVYRSEPLLSLLKRLNDYSNNIFKPFADAAGGPRAIEVLARNSVPAAMRSEIVLGDGAGSDPDNRLSPRAAVKLLRALAQELAATGHTLVDALPVAGVDEGTLLHRLDSPDEVGRVVGKTGTFGDYGASALIGAIRSTARGTVYFAVLNHNVPVPQARRRQNRFLRVLLDQMDSIPWGYTRDDHPAVARAEVSIQPPAVRPEAGPSCRSATTHAARDSSLESPQP